MVNRPSIQLNVNGSGNGINSILSQGNKVNMG